MHSAAATEYRLARILGAMRDEFVGSSRTKMTGSRS
jgi:hypothetical protein